VINQREIGLKKDRLGPVRFKSGSVPGEPNWFRRGIYMLWTFFHTFFKDSFSLFFSYSLVSLFKSSSFFEN